MLKRGMTTFVLVAAGALFPLALAPLFWWPVGLLSLAIFYYFITRTRTPAQAFGVGWWYALGKFGAGVSWVYVSMNQYGGTPAALAILMVFLFAAGLALLPAFWFWLSRKLISHSTVNNAHTWLSFAAFWLFAEWSRGWFLTGFPWLYAGDGHLDTWLSGWIPVIGSLGVSLICALTASAMVELLKQRKAIFLAIWLLWLAGLVLQAMEWTQKTGELTVSAVQGNIAQNIKWNPEMLNPTIQIYTEQSEQLWESDLILWPETAVPMVMEYFQPYLDSLDQLAQTEHSGLITGIVYRHPAGTELAGAYHNSLVAVGTADGIYHKQKLVPFGEFVPFEEQLRGLIPFFDLEMSSFTSGSDQQPLLEITKEADTFTLAPYICYEIAYPLLVADMAAEADMLITVSNDAWFGDSLGPKQHMALARMRALETGRYLLRSTNTGITALVDHRGETIIQLPTGERTHLTGKAEMREGKTPFMIWHVLPALTLSILFVLYALFAQRQQRASFSSEELING